MVCFIKRFDDCVVIFAIVFAEFVDFAGKAGYFVIYLCI